MKAIDLNGQWTMECQNGEKLSTMVPGSVASTLLAHGKMDDPYYRDNEKKVQPVFDEDYRFFRSFEVPQSVLAHDRLLLHCDGLDTLAEISLNGQVLGHADNMYRTWVFDVKPLLRVGENTLSILFSSPVRYIEEHPAKVGKRYSSIRKAACMFGWDWGLNLPDSGIWRDIYIEAFDAGRIVHLGVRQHHEADRVRLEIAPQAEAWREGVRLELAVAAPDGSPLLKKTVPANGGTHELLIDAPELWWPVGQGAQPLYGVSCRLMLDGQELDNRKLEIGMRTIQLDRTAEGDGSRYRFVVNGRRVFFKGENLIIEDSILSRTTPARWEQLIKNCLVSNLNGIRVWGGAVYPPDIFYQLCDRYGLLVYQDFMFACSFYMLSPAFLDNVRHEVEDNLRRIAHHPCIALYCGNNEIEGSYTTMGSDEPETVALRKLFGSGEKATDEQRAAVWGLYAPLFLELIPNECARYAPDTGYVHSSPSVPVPGTAKSFFEYTRNGDMHYYLQYNGNAPYQRMREMRCRFMTEMGFQSYPSVKTIHAFTAAEDRSPYSDVMYSHQKCFKGNETIELYMARDYIVPSKFENYVWLSQYQAAEIMRYSNEHFRRDNTYCSGSVLWQLNDCWPVVSWSGIDYYGRWKALQYATRRFFAPVLVSALDEGTRVGLWVSNESPDAFEGRLAWRLCDGDDSVVQSGEVPVACASAESREYTALDFTDVLDGDAKTCYHLEYELLSGGGIVGGSTVLFCLAKDFRFRLPEIMLSVAEESGRYAVDVTTDRYARGLALDTRDGDCVFSDNWFDLPAGGAKRVWVEKVDANGIASAQALAQALYATSLNQIMLEG